MNKYAGLVVENEVRGVLAACADSGLLKVASAASFDKLAAIVARNLPENYDLETVLAVTDHVLSKKGGNTKIASEQDVTMALGHLLMAKMAGEIDNQTFAKEAAGVMNTLRGIPGKLRDGFIDAPRRALASHRLLKADDTMGAAGKTYLRNNRNAALARTAKYYGGAAAGLGALGGAGYGVQRYLGNRDNEAVYE